LWNASQVGQVKVMTARGEGSRGRTSTCPIACALNEIGDRWTLVVIRDMYFFNKQRFEEFLQSPEKISTNILSERLRRLEQLGLITRQPYSSHSQRMNYLLTERGQTLGPILEALVKWGLENIPGTNIPKVET
jgi:DNA-binding HxlR family transcriptional regulator